MCRRFSLYSCRRILFGPLTGIEVVDTRVDGTVVVIECAFSINLTAMTLEQVLNKRFKTLQVRSSDGHWAAAEHLELASGSGVSLATECEHKEALRARKSHQALGLKGLRWQS